MACGLSTLKLSRRVIDFEYKGHVTEMKRDVLKCDVCNEYFFQPKDERELDRILADERRKVDGLLTTQEIKAIRNRFGMTQVQFSKFLRLGEKTFARYENADGHQNVAIDNLLRVLNEFPEAISVFHNIPRKSA